MHISDQMPKNRIPQQHRASQAEICAKEWEPCQDGVFRSRHSDQEFSVSTRQSWKPNLSPALQAPVGDNLAIATQTSLDLSELGNLPGGSYVMRCRTHFDGRETFTLLQASPENLETCVDHRGTFAKFNQSSATFCTLDGSNFSASPHPMLDRFQLAKPGTGYDVINPDDLLYKVSGSVATDLIETARKGTGPLVPDLVKESTTFANKAKYLIGMGTGVVMFAPVVLGSAVAAVFGPEKGNKSSG